MNGVPTYILSYIRYHRPFSFEVFFFILSPNNNKNQDQVKATIYYIPTIQFCKLYINIILISLTTRNKLLSIRYCCATSTNVMFENRKNKLKMTQCIVTNKII